MPSTAKPTNLLSATIHHEHTKLAPPTNTCPTGCVFGSAEHAAHSEATTRSVSREHLVEPPGGIPTYAPYHEFSQKPLADLIAEYGSSSSTAWLDSKRYKIWRPSQPIPESTFTPVLGYIQRDPYVFAWGNPLVSAPTALEKTARAFIAFAEAEHLHPVWCCVDHDLEAILTGQSHEWATVSCIHEDVMDPAHVVELLSPGRQTENGEGGDLKKNLTLAEKDHVEVHEVKKGEWEDKERVAVETCIKEWKAHKPGMEFDTMTLDPWVDEPHRRYWIAKHKGKVVGLEILSHISPTSWHIVKCLALSHAPVGVSETLVYTALKDLYTEQEELANATPIPAMTIVQPESTTVSPEDVPDRVKNRVMISFGITAADHLEAGHNISGWKVSVLSRTYQAVSGVVGLMKNGKYREKFDVTKEPMYVCYPSNHFGFLAISALLIALRS